MGISFGQWIYAALWWGPFRRVFEPAARRVLASHRRVLAGTLRGAWVEGGLAEKLGIYELHIQQALTSLLKPGDVVLDVGANTGYFSLYCSRLVMPGGRIVAIEPLPENAEKLERMLKQNGSDNTRIVAAAASDMAGQATLSIGSGHATPSLLGHGGSTLEVRTVTLDQLGEQPNLLIIDVEGAEVKVLAGARSILRCCRPLVIVEVHGEEYELEVVRLFQEFLYSTEHLAGARRLRYPKHLLARPALSEAGPNAKRPADIS